MGESESKKNSQDFEALDLELIPSPLLVVEKDSLKVRYINKSARQLIQTSSDKVLDSPLDNFIARSPKKVIDNLLTLAEQGKNTPVVSDLRSNKDIKRVQIRPNYYSPNGTGYLILTLEEITDFKSNQKLEAVIDAMPDAGFVITGEGEYLQVLTKEEDLLSAPEEVLLNSNIEEQLSPEAARKCLEAIKKSLSEKEIQTVEYSLKVPAGRLHFQARISPLSENEVVFIARNITEHIKREAKLMAYTQQLEAAEQQLQAESEERQQLEKELKESKKFLQDVTDIVPAVVYVFKLSRNGEFSFEFVNEYSQDLLGYSPQELEADFSQAWARILPEDLSKVKNSIEESGREYKEWKCDFRVTDASGELKWIHGVSEPYKSNPAGDKFFIGILSDITGHKELSEKLQDLLRNKETLLKEVHHRVKNNMQVISSILKLQSHYVPGEKLAQIVNDCENRIRAMALVQERLYSEDNFSEIDFQCYVQELADMLFSAHRDQAVGKEKVINVEDIKLSIDFATPCGLIIQELVSNCLQHAFEEGEDGKIEIIFGRFQDKEDARYYELKVRDTGSGIPEELDEKTSESLGLTLVESLAVDQLQGDLKIDTNNGTCFKIKFPAKAGGSRITSDNI